MKSPRWTLGLLAKSMNRCCASTTTSMVPTQLHEAEALGDDAVVASTYGVMNLKVDGISQHWHDQIRRGL
ncbi:MAG: hypothetical protein R2688_01030 [Fimbriimonadaceae bacterium]